MTLHTWKDYNRDLDARDRARDFWHGLLVFVAVMTIASLFACEQQPYNPELSNALTLEPIDWHPQASLTETHSPLADDPHVIGCGWPDDQCSCPPIPPPMPKVQKVTLPRPMEHTPPVGLWGTLRF